LHSFKTMQMKFEKLNSFKNLALVTLFILNTVTINAQVIPKSLSMEEAIQAAVQNNKQLLIAKTDEAIAKSNFNQTEAIWLPNVNLSQTAYRTNNPLNVFGFKLQQASVLQADFNPAILNNPNNYSNYNTQLALQQPIINLDALYMRKAAKEQVGMYAAQVQRTKEAIKMQVVQSYLYLEFTYQYEKVTVEGLKTMQSIYKFTKDRFDQGMMQKSDLLNVAVQVQAAELQHSQAKSQIENMSDQLTVLMGAPKGVVYSTKPYNLSPQTDISDSVSSGRSDIRALNAAVNSYDMAIKSTEMSWMPKLNAFANYNINDKSIAFNGAKSYIAGVQLSWDIFKGNQMNRKAATQRLEKTKVQQQLTIQLETGAAEIRKTKRAVVDANYKIQQQTTSVQQSEEALRILQNRYEQGLVSTNDILVAQTQLSQQKLFLAQAQLEQKSAINYLEFLTTK
jgi:outer membrane protein TolC